MNSMKKKINIYLLTIALMTICATLFLSMSVFYRHYENQITSDLTTVAYLLEETMDMESEYVPKDENLRVTMIDAQGDVVYDSVTDAESLDNHADRPEVQEAMENGIGQAKRHSDSINQSNYYVALKLDNGNILRVARTTNSLTNIFLQALPMVLLLCALEFICIIFVAGFLTRSILKPIENIANQLDEIDETQVYPEFTPFVATIKSQHEKVLSSAKLRQDFTANVTHELKTPLTSISGYSELIESGMASEADVKHFAHEIHRSAKRLLTTINDILRLSELDSAGEEVFEKVDLYEIAASCIDSLTMQAQKYDVDVKLQGTRAVVNANREMMVELFSNFIDNAIRYNHKGGHVWVSVAPLSDEVLVSVKDSGIGIPLKHQQRIFERFYRVDKSRSKATGGTGLGLAIVKHIVMRHDASLEVKSEPDKGTEMIVHFHKA